MPLGQVVLAMLHDSRQCFVAELQLAVASVPAGGVGQFAAVVQPVLTQTLFPVSLRQVSSERHSASLPPGHMPQRCWTQVLSPAGAMLSETTVHSSSALHSELVAHTTARFVLPMVVHWAAGRHAVL